MSDDSSSSSSSEFKEEEDSKPLQSKDVKSAKPGEQPKKKKKKNAPDRPQPAWLFPPDAENPVLNPKTLSPEELKKQYEERFEAIRFLKHKAVTAPMKTAPPTQLLTLIGAFLASYGFNSTGRLFTLERNARKKLDGWNDEVGAKLEKGTPDLVKIYKDWSKEWHERRELDMTSSDDDDDAATKRAKMVKKRSQIDEDKINGVDKTSSSGSDDSSSSSDSGVGTEGKKEKVSLMTASKNMKIVSPSSVSSASSTSDSDADDENGTTSKARSRSSTSSNLVNKLKRKASSSGTSSPTSNPNPRSETNSDSSSPDSPKVKKAKVNTSRPAQKSVSTKSAKPSQKALADASQKKAAPRQASPSESSSDSTSDSDQNEVVTKTTLSVVSQVPKKPRLKSKTPIVNGRKFSTDSSTTLNESLTNQSTSLEGAAVKATIPSSASASSSSDIDVNAPKDVVSNATKRKRSASPKAPTAKTTNTKNTKIAKKTNTPFSRIPQNTKVDSKLASNAYIPYDYAEKAHQDLSVTKGKGFTKEKNKKKRGAYRGGVIDVGGGKGVKFDD